MAFALVGTIGAVSLGAVTTAVTPAWGTSENRTAGNLLVLWVDVHGSATLPAAPSGWTIGIQKAGTTCSASLFYKLAAGSDAAPTIAAITSGYIQARLAEFTPGASKDQTGSNAGTGSTIVATQGAQDSAVGDLIVAAGCSYYSAAATKTTSHTITGATCTLTQTKNDSTSLARHYNFGYGVTTGSTGADVDTYAQTTTSITGGAVAVMSFKVAAALAGTATGQSAVPAAALTTAIQLVGSSAGQCAVAGALTTVIQLVGTTIVGQSAVSATTLLGAPAALVGSAAGQSNVPAAALTTAIRLVGASAGQSVASAALTTAITLLGVSTGQSNAPTAALTTAIRLVGSVSVQSVVPDADLTTGGPLIGAALVGESDAVSAASGALTTAITLLGSIGCVASVAGSLTTTPKTSGITPDIYFRRLDSRGRPVVAASMYDSLVAQHGVREGERIYFAMAEERKGAFAPGAKYADRRPLTPTVPAVPQRSPLPPAVGAPVPRVAPLRFITPPPKRTS